MQLQQLALVGRAVEIRSNRTPARAYSSRTSSSAAASSTQRNDYASARLEELDHVARRILDQDLRAARSLHDLVPERHAFRAEPFDLGGEVVDDQMDPVPAAWFRAAAVGHGPPRRAGRPAQQQPQVAALNVSERGCLVRELYEAEVRRVERDGGVHVVDHVADVDRGHSRQISKMKRSASCASAGAFTLSSTRSPARLTSNSRNAQQACSAAASMLILVSSSSSGANE